MPIMTLKQRPKLGTIMPPTTPGGLMLALSCLTAELSGRLGSAGKYEPCFIRASVTATLGTGWQGACKDT